jgi:hypothetical protein
MRKLLLWYLLGKGSDAPRVFVSYSKQDEPVTIIVPLRTSVQQWINKHRKRG